MSSQPILISPSTASDAFTRLGLTEVAYVKTIPARDAVPGEPVHEAYRADGTLLARTPALETMLAIVYWHELEPMRVH
jgi:hypothetical protein